MLQGTEARCPSCGAPPRALRKTRRPGALTIAGILFISIFIMSSIGWAVNLYYAAELAGKVQATGKPAHELSGTVEAPDGSAVRAANVTLLWANGTVHQTAQSDGNGTFHFGALQTGNHTLKIEAPQHSTLYYRTYIQGDSLEVRPRLSPGNTTVWQDHSSFQTAVSMARVVYGVIWAVTGVHLVAAVACFRRRWYPVTLLASVLGLLAFFVGDLYSALLALVNMVLVVRNRAAFGKRA